MLYALAYAMQNSESQKYKTLSKQIYIECNPKLACFVLCINCMNCSVIYNPPEPIFAPASEDKNAAIESLIMEESSLSKISWTG